MTDDNGLIYMRARYYSPKLRRFANADIIHGTISNAVTLNRYAYANGNPVSNIDPFGLSAERGNSLVDSFSGRCPVKQNRSFRFSVSVMRTPPQCILSTLHHSTYLSSFQLICILRLTLKVK